MRSYKKPGEIFEVPKTPTLRPPLDEGISAAAAKPKANLRSQQKPKQYTCIRVY
jgi:hypothetical protein